MRRYFLAHVRPTSLIAIGILSLTCTNADAEIRLRDGFEYVVNRDQTGKSAVFAANSAWGGAKSNPENPGACGYIYTAGSIPGFTGAFPGTSSSRVLAMEFLPRSMGCLVSEGWWQSDAYLSFGGQGAAQNTVPANLWVQFWIYVNDYGTQQTRWGNTKWLYPCIDGIYPCSGSNVSWLYNLRPGTLNPWHLELPAGGSEFYTYFTATGAYYLPGDPEPGPWKLSHNVSRDTGRLTGNRWTLVKIHIDISGTQGVYQEWHKEVGGSFLQVTNWVGDNTPDFTWPLTGMNPARTQGQKSLRLGTTWNNSDGWIYLDDFVMATSEADLPVYGGTNPPPPPTLRAPINLRVVPN